jgi:hypothetical protein
MTPNIAIVHVHNPLPARLAPLDPALSALGFRSSCCRRFSCSSLLAICFLGRISLWRTHLHLLGAFSAPCRASMCAFEAQGKITVLVEILLGGGCDAYPNDRKSSLCLAARRIDLAEAERLLILVGGRDRFFTLVLTAVVVIAFVSANPSLSGLSQFHLGARLYETLRSMLESVNGSEAFHQPSPFLFADFLGELP